jgi:hypothetical protein
MRNESIKVSVSVAVGLSLTKYFCTYLEHYLLNICQSEKYFEQKLQRELKHMLHYNSCPFGHYPSSRFFIKNNVSETGLCLRPQLKPYSVGLNRQS